MAKANTIAEVVAGEAISGTREERIADMRAIASVIANRAQQLGITPQEVVANSNEFNAYGRPLPPGVGSDLVDLAQEQIDYVNTNGPTNAATFYATPSAADGLPSGLSYETETAGHQFYSDPLGRSINSSLGYVKPNAYAYAQNPTNVPTPYSPAEIQGSLINAFQPAATQTVDPFSSILSGNAFVAPQSGDQFKSTTGPVPPADYDPGLLPGNPDMAASGAYAVNEEDAPKPYGRDDIIFFDQIADDVMPSATGALGIPNAQEPGISSGLTNGILSKSVAAHPSDFGDFTTPGLEASATVPGFSVAPAPTATNQPITQADANRAFFNPTGNGVFDPSFSEGLMSPTNPVVPTSVQTTSFSPTADQPVASDMAASRFSTPAKTDRIGGLPGLVDTARMNPLTGAIDPATNTASFMDNAPAPANLGSMPDAYAAQRGPTSGLLSADAMTMQGLAEKQLAESIASRAVPSLSVPASGILTGNQPFAAQTTVQAPASVLAGPAQPAIDAITTTSTTPGILSGSPIATANAPLTSSVTSTDLTGKSILGGQPVQQNQFVGSFPAAVANNTIEPAAVNDVVAAPTLDTIQVADQPSVASIEGPTTTPALDQQQTQTVANTVQAARPQPTVQAAQNTKSFKDSVLSKETALGSILGGVVAGPPGAILGGLVGQQTAQGGGLTGLLSGGGFMAPTTQIGGGLANIAGIYGGQYSPGTYSVASNGATVTAQPGGYTGYTNKYGVSETISPTGQISHNFGSLFGGNAPATPDTAV